MTSRFERKPRTPHEQTLLDATAQLLPSGARSPSSQERHAMIVREGHGARVVDESGNEYLDFLLGSGSLFLGHANPHVVEAVRKRLDRGSAYLMLSEPAVELAGELVRSVPCAEKVCLANTGSEATFYALRLARAFRKRDKILKFEGAYNGQSDYLLMSNQWTGRPAPFPAPVPNSAGIPQSARDEVWIAPFNDVETTLRILDQHREELGAVIVEPMQRTVPPQQGFLQALREATARYGIPLIFDEIVTGYRLSYGSAQGYYGVTPDLCAIGKSLSAGFPIAAVCGRADILEGASGRRLGRPDYVSLTGTYSGNPISCTAAVAALEVLREPGTYERVFALGRRFMTSLQSLFDRAGIPVRVTGEPPAFQPWFTSEQIVDHRSILRADAAKGMRFTELLLDRGILKAHEKFFVSVVHTDDDIDRALEACASAIDEMRSH